MTDHIGPSGLMVPAACFSDMFPTFCRHVTRSDVGKIKYYSTTIQVSVVYISGDTVMPEDRGKTRVGSARDRLSTQMEGPKRILELLKQIYTYGNGVNLKI